MEFQMSSRDLLIPRIAWSFPGPFVETHRRRTGRGRPCSRRGLRGALAEVQGWGRARAAEVVGGGPGSLLSGAEAEILRDDRLGGGRGKLARNHAARGAAGTVHGTRVRNPARIPLRGRTVAIRRFPRSFRGA
ncbi:hypothetical protein [Sorangium sp. So ce233]|uniref:hypothetical protein n=1 Tax=Sorangium sp. So ce233 TaxID=3133290 RepID=UPI003F5EE22C